MTFVKICGLRSTNDAEGLNKAQSDCAGVILSGGYRRSVSFKTAKDIRNELDSKISLCGVFVNETAEYIRTYIEAGIIDRVQLHGQEEAAYVNQLKECIPGIPVIQAFRIKEAEALQRAAESPADIVLLDSGAGTGKTFDWNLLTGFSRPYILAGGLDPDNVAQAIAHLHPFGVDTSSGVETDGIKDHKKMMDFVKAARNGEKE